MLAKKPLRERSQEQRKVDELAQLRQGFALLKEEFCHQEGVYKAQKIQQVVDVVTALYDSGVDTPSIVSVFAGRIADTGVDPVPHMKAASCIVKSIPNCELLWASPREVINVIQADECGCDIITATPSILKKLDTSHGKDLEQFSLETVQMFYNDAKAAGYKL